MTVIHLTLKHHKILKIHKLHHIKKVPRAMSEVYSLTGKQVHRVRSKISRSGNTIQSQLQ